MFPSGILASTGMKPDLIPAAAAPAVPLVIVAFDAAASIGAHGLSKLDWVTVWLPAQNWNCTMEPGSAVMLSGQNCEPVTLFAGFWPTETTWTSTAGYVNY